MRLFIDASNIRSGGGVIHLVELLRVAKPNAYGFEQVVVWASAATLEQLEERPWLIMRTDSSLEGSYFRRLIWQRYQLDNLTRAAGCDLLFVPGGSFGTSFRPVVVMSQNLLPFEKSEWLRYGLSATTLRLALLRWSQFRSFHRASGTIFLTRYAKDVVLRVTGNLAGATVLIPHGIDQRFFRPPRPQRSLWEYDDEHPIRLVYVSIIDTYKHQWHVAEAVAQLKGEGLPVALDMIGPAYPPALKRLLRTLSRVDPSGNFIRYSGALSHQDIQASYAATDISVFASSCETFGQILTEAMAAGLPVACSGRSAMPEILGESGVYFDPERPHDIADALRLLITNPDLRMRCAEGAYEKARNYTWENCASQTFAFLAMICQQNKLT